MLLRVPSFSSSREAGAFSILIMVWFSASRWICKSWLLRVVLLFAGRFSSFFCSSC